MSNGSNMVDKKETYIHIRNTIIISILYSSFVTECLNLDNDEKTILAGSEFQTLTIHSIK